MKNATHRVVILKNCNSDLISQAIFFLKDSKNESDTKILAEAEKIVEKYMSSRNSSDNILCELKPGKHSNFIGLLFIGMTFLALLGIIIALI